MDTCYLIVFKMYNDIFDCMFRLTEERQTAAEQRLCPPAAEDNRQKMLDSLSKAGVDNFTMKAAVPGTEVPGHKVQSSTTSCFCLDSRAQEILDSFKLTAISVFKVQMNEKCCCC